MKALSLIEPWASLVAMGHKKYETRSWRFPEGAEGRMIAIHASKSREAIRDGTADRLFALGGIDLPKHWPLGKIVAVARLGSVKSTESVRINATLGSLELQYGNYADGRFAWPLFDLRRLPTPIACRGMLGLWTVLPAIESEIVRQVA